MRLRRGSPTNQETAYQPKGNHPDRTRNINYFKDKYIKNAIQKNEYVNSYVEQDETIAWFIYSPPIGKYGYRSGRPIAIHQDHSEFAGECNKYFLSVNNQAWKSVKGHQND